VIGVWIVWGEHQGEGVRWDAPDGGVRADGVVFLTPVVDEQACFGQGREPVLVEAVVTEGAVEGFDESVLHGFAGLDVVDGDTCGLSPEVEGATGELGAIVGGDGGGQAAGGGELLEDGDDGRATDGSIVDWERSAAATEPERRPGVCGGACDAGRDPPRDRAVRCACGFGRAPRL